MGQFGVRDILNCILKDRSTGEPKLMLRTLKVSNLDFSAATVNAVGGRGAPILLQFKGEKSIVLNCEEAMVSTDFLQVMAGATALTATATVSMFEIKTITSTGSVTAKYEPLGSTGDQKFVFKSSDGVTFGSALSYTAVATADTYQFSGTRFSFDPAGSGMNTGSTILLSYYFTASAATKTINFDSDNFSGYYTLEAETLWKNSEDGLDYPAIITADKVALDDNFSIPMSNTGDPATFSFNITCMKPSNDNTLLSLQILEGDPDS